MIIISFSFCLHHEAHPTVKSSDFVKQKSCVCLTIDCLGGQVCFNFGISLVSACSCERKRPAFVC